VSFLHYRAVFYVATCLDALPLYHWSNPSCNQLSASSAALDFNGASEDSVAPETSSAVGWGLKRNRQSLNGAPSTGSTQSSELSSSAIGSRPTTLRGQSQDMKFFSDTSSEATGSMASPPTVLATPPKLTQSFSANDIPTVKNAMGTAGLTAQQQQFHNHNASLGRIPPGALPNRHSREMSNDNAIGALRDPVAAYNSLNSTLQANAAPFGPAATPALPTSQTAPAITSPTPSSGYSGYYHSANYGGLGAVSTTSPYSNGGMPLVAMMQNMNINGANGVPSNLYHSANYTGYSPVYAQAVGLGVTQGQQPRDSQARVIQSRRLLDSEGKRFLRHRFFICLIANQTS
jgi:hypothetical protein